MSVRVQTLGPWIAQAAAAVVDTEEARDISIANAAATDADAIATAADRIAIAAMADPGYRSFVSGWIKERGWPDQPSLIAVAAPGLPWPTYATLTRAGTAKSFGPNGYIFDTPANTLRDRFHPVTGAYLGKRFEGRGAQNRWLQSTAFLTSPNQMSHCTPTAAQTLGPDGTVSGWFFRENTDTNTHGVLQSIAFTIDEWYTHQAIVKSATRVNCWLGLPANAFDLVSGNTQSSFFNTTTGIAKSDQGNPIRRSEYLGNGWWRVFITELCQASVTGSPGFRMATGNETNNDFYAGDNTSGLYVHSISTFKSANPNEPITTAASVVSVPSERMTWTGVAATTSKTGGTRVFGGVYLYLSGIAETLWSFDDTTTSNTIRLRKGSNEILVAEMHAGGVLQASITLGTIVAGERFCVVVAWAQDDFAASMNGEPPTCLLDGDLPAVTALRTGSNADSTNGMDCCIEVDATFGYRADNAQLPMLSRTEAPSNTYGTSILQGLAAPTVMAQRGPAIVCTKPTYSQTFEENGFSGATFLRDGDGKGWVFGIPFSSPDLLIIDPAAQTAELTDWGTTLNEPNTGATGSRWSGACRLTDSTAICAPQSAEKFLLIDAAAQTLTLDDFGLDLTGTQKWNGAVKGHNGKVYFGPYSRGTVGIYDPATDTLVEEDFDLAIMSSGDKLWGRGVLHPVTGCIYYPPYKADRWLVIDTTYETARAYTSTFGFGPLALPATFGSEGNYQSASIDYKGRIIALPFDANLFGVLDPYVGKITYEALGLDLPVGKGLWSGAAPMGDGTIMGMPLDAAVVSAALEAPFARFDPKLRETTLEYYGAVPWTNGHQSNGIAIADDGYAYGMPYGFGFALRIGPFPKLSEEILMSPYVSAF